MNEEADQGYHHQHDGCNVVDAITNTDGVGAGAEPFEPGLNDVFAAVCNQLVESDQSSHKQVDAQDGCSNHAAEPAQLVSEKNVD